MEMDFVCRRAHLRQLLKEHSEWSCQQIADAVGCSTSMVYKWKRRFAQADPTDVSVLFSRSRAAHRHLPRTALEVVRRILEMRLAPPDHLKRTPGPKALLYYLHKQEAPGKASGERVLSQRLLLCHRRSKSLPVLWERWPKTWNCSVLAWDLTDTDR